MALELILPQRHFPVKAVLQILSLARDFDIDVLLGFFLKLGFPLAGLQCELVADVRFFALPFMFQFRLLLAVLGLEELFFFGEVLLPKLLLRLKFLGGFADLRFRFGTLFGERLLVLFGQLLFADRPLGRKIFFFLKQLFHEGCLGFLELVIQMRLALGKESFLLGQIFLKMRQVLDMQVRFLGDVVFFQFDAARFERLLDMLELGVEFRARFNKKRLVLAQPFLFLLFPSDLKVFLFVDERALDFSLFLPELLF